MCCMLWTVRLSRGCFEKRNTMGALKKNTTSIYWELSDGIRFIGKSIYGHGTIYIVLGKIKGPWPSTFAWPWTDLEKA